MDLPRRLCERSVDRFKDRHPAIASIPAGIEIPPEPEMGDLSVALPMRAADPLERPPREIGDELAQFLDQELDQLERVSVDGPGFVNLVFRDEYLCDQLEQVIEGPFDFPDRGEGRSVLIEFVSANPTGPLHVGHGRGGVYGDALARLLDLHGFDVTREYYVNDAGSQVQRLGESLRLRARELRGEEVSLGENHYQGEYIADLASRADLSAEASVAQWSRFGKGAILEGIFEVLSECRIHYDSVVRESEVASRDRVDELIDELRASDHVYEREGATFLRTTRSGDDKDRVLIRANGEPTYFANDLVYHREKFRRGYDRMIDVWGHDHHGYQDRMRGGLELLGLDAGRLTIELYQLVDLYRGGQPVAMSTRAGEFVPLEVLLEEVGVDAVRFNFLTAGHNRPLDFDIEVATSRDEENPVYYVQYAHTRMASILREDHESLRDRDPLEEFTSEGHRLLLHALDLPYVSQLALEKREPHLLTHYLRDLARQFHSYYGHQRVLDLDHPRRSALRVRLVQGLKRVIQSGLSILGVSAPERM